MIEGQTVSRSYSQMATHEVRKRLIGSDINTDSRTDRQTDRQTDMQPVHL